MAKEVTNTLESKRPKSAKRRNTQRTNQRRTAIWSAPLLVAALLFVFGYCSQPAFALEGLTAPAEETPFVRSLPEETQMEQTTEQTSEVGKETPNPLDTPTPVPSPFADAESTATPTQSASPEPTSALEPTATPESSATPQPGRTDEFTGTAGKLSVRVTTTDPAADSSVAVQTVLNLDRLNASDDAETYARYLALLDGVVPETALKNCKIIALQYRVDGSAIVPPQTPASIRILDEEHFSAYTSDSMRVYCLFEGEESFVETTEQSVNLSEGMLDCSAPHCPSVIVLSGEPAPESSATPETGATPEPTIAPAYVFEGDGLYVTGSPASADVLPEGAQLFAERITAESSPEQYALYQSMLQTEYATELPIAFVAYNIYFRVEGQEVEPYGDVVNVTISDEAYLQSVEAPQVYHIVGEESDAPVLEELAAQETKSAEGAEVSFASDSFSTFIVLPGGSRLTNMSIQAEAETFTHTSYYNSGSPLGIAGSFHIVAFNNAVLGAHTNGNVLAKNLFASNNFGTKNLANELSYIQNYTTVNGGSASSTAHVLAIGSSNTVTLTDGGNSFVINGTKLDSPWNLWKDASTTTLPFVDLAAVHTSTKSIASSLAGKSTVNVTSHLSTSAGSCTESYLTLTDPDKVGIYNITASAISGYSYFGVQGFQSGHNGTVIINVNCAGVSSNITLPECRMYYGSGGTATAVNFAEVTSFVNGRILWNLVNCTTTVTTRLMYASLLAPDATITVGQNLNGTVIGNNVTISAESHRDDFVGSLSNGVTVTGSKVWTDYGTGAPANTSVTFQLYRSTDGGATRTAYGSPVTLNSTTGWTYDWTELPTGSLYTIVETTVLKGSTDITTSYAATYSTQTGVSSGTITVSNLYLYALPMTGGIGARVYVVLGALLCLMAVCIWSLQTKRQGADAL